MVEGIPGFFVCEVCHIGVYGVDFYAKFFLIQYVNERILTLACSFVLEYDVCWGYVHTSYPVIAANLVDFLLSPSFFCQEVVHMCKKVDYLKLDPNEYIRRILSDKPESIKNNTFLNDLYA